MDMQNVSNLTIPEGEVRTIHNSNNQLLWGRVNYGTKYAGDTLQDGTPTPDAPIPVQVVTGAQVVSITDGTNTQNLTVNLGSTELAKIGNYQDYIYKSGDDWYVHKECTKVVLDGTQADLAFANGVVYGATSISFSSSGLYSNYFSYGGVATDTTGAYNKGNNKISLHISMDRFYIRNDNLANLSDWKTWLGTHNTSMYLQLATPTDTQITDSTLIGQLNAVHEWLTRYGYNATVSGNLPIIIDRTNL